MHRDEKSTVFYGLPIQLCVTFRTKPHESRKNTLQSASAREAICILLSRNYARTRWRVAGRNHSELMLSLPIERIARFLNMSKPPRWLVISRQRFHYAANLAHDDDTGHATDALAQPNDTNRPPFELGNQSNFKRSRWSAASRWARR